MIFNNEIKENKFYELSNIIINNLNTISYLQFGDNNENEFFENKNYPQSINLCNLMDSDYSAGIVLDSVRKFVYDIEKNNNVECKLCVYYPNNGYIGWHTNHSFNCHNAICTYSQTGNSYFEYYDGSDKIKIYDEIGWSVKKTKWGKNPIINHRAISKTNRITMTFSSNYEDIIDNFIEKIT